MLIVCPSCASSYSLTPEQLGAGRSLRCAKCRHTWHATPADSLDEPVDAVMTKAADTDRARDAAVEADAAHAEMVEPLIPAEQQATKSLKPSGKPKHRAAKKPRKPFKVSAGLAAAAMLVVVLAAGLGLRAKIVKILPQTAGLYAAVGLPVNLRGLEFSALRSELLVDKDKAVLLVEGEITGVAAQTTEIPKVTVSLRGPEGREIYAWTSEVGRAALAKGESTTFRARLASPPGEGRDVVVRFAETAPQAPTH
ncbi:thioredoxin [Alsobacter metallidurans]|uniref:Thioredoxin n=1 Tax=Alsobacter metallidurans TaxID=340221 RepID=A0A917MJV0_9HYPH|nr:zinc-ribbon domain-containing protein [Alsobacter metallidurans]GGH33467.1 thioredoxin [Alsobacter metallidurans]